MDRIFLQITSVWLWRDATIEIARNMPFALTDAKLNRLLKRSSEGKHISRLRLHYHADIPDVYIADFKLRLDRLLRDVHQLKILSVRDASKNMVLASFLTSNIEHHHHFRLTELTYHITTTAEFWDFIRSQPEIRRLVLSHPQNFGWSKEMEPLPSETLPNLHVVMAPLAFLCGLIPGRPVSGVSMALNEGLAVADVHLLWQALTKSSVRLTSLTVILSSTDSFRALFAGLPEYAPAVPGRALLGVGVQYGMDSCSG